MAKNRVFVVGVGMTKFEKPGSREATATAPLAPRHVDQLAWLGLDAETVQRLQPYVELLPEATPLNINTASAEVLAGVIAGLDPGSAQRIVSRRPYKRLDDARNEIQGEGALDPKRLSVGSSYFEITGRLRMDGRVLEERLLVKRQNREVIALWRSRQSLK